MGCNNLGLRHALGHIDIQAVYSGGNAMTAHASLKARYATHLYVGFLVAVLIHALAFAFWPEYVPSVYKLKEIKIPEWIELPHEIEIPPPPKEIEPPELPMDLTPSDDVDNDETIPPTIFSPRDLPRIPQRPPEGPQQFFGFDTAPKVVRGAKPTYPELARKAEVEGTVVVLATIDQEGKVIQAWIAHSDAQIFEDTALEAAYQYRFTPGKQNGIPVKATVSLTFRFTLHE
jgi:protein TonB